MLDFHPDSETHQEEGLLDASAVQDSPEEADARVKRLIRMLGLSGFDKVSVKGWLCEQPVD